MEIKKGILLLFCIFAMCLAADILVPSQMSLDVAVSSYSAGD